VTTVLPAGLGPDPEGHIAAVRALRSSAPPRILELRAGDAVLFDHLNVHRSAGGRHYTGIRRSAEFWFFAPSTFPAQLTPMMLRPADG
jgi:hypothetical protein